MTLSPEICQLELHVSDLTKSLQFFAEVFGWTAVPADMHEYVVLSVPEDCPFGVALVPDAKRARGTGGFIPYFRCDDPEEILRRVRKAGGTVRFGPKHLASYGDIYQFEDLDGQRFGLFKR